MAAADHLRDKQPLTFSVNEHLDFLSQKFVVDCAGRRLGTGIMDSNNAKDRLTAPAAMRWQALNRTPLLARAVCEER